MALRLNDVALSLSPPLAARCRRRSGGSSRSVAVASMTSAVSTKVENKKPFAPPREVHVQVTHSMPAQKIEIFKSLDDWARDNILTHLKPVEKCWQPQDFLPDPSSEGFHDEVKELRERAKEIPDDYFVCLVGDMITEEALPTYQTMLNTLDGVRDETGASPTAWAVWTRAWTAEENRHGDLLNKYMYLTGRVDMRQIEKTIQYLIGSGMIGNNARLHEDTEGASMMTATPPPSAMTAATPPPSPTTPSSTPPEATGNNLQRPASPASGGQDRRELELQRANPSTEPRRRDLVNAQTTPQHGSPAPRTPAAPLPSANRTQVQRFRPGLVYTRRRARGPGGSRAGPSCSPTPSPTTLRTRTSPRSAQAATLPRAEIAATAFVQSLARALPQPLLQAPRRRASSTLRHRKAAAPVRRSVRIAAMSWPRGDAQAKARQVLMKKMGIVEEEGLSAEDLILRYIDLFRGPLTDMTIKAIAALCGLDSAPAASTAQA